MRAREFLNEYTRQQTTQNWGQKLVTAAKRDPTIPVELRRQGEDAELIDMVLSQLESADPTKNKEYTQGLAKLYANGGLKMEDATSTLADYLTKFHKLKAKRMIPAGQNDFLRYRTAQEFMSAVDQLPDPDEQTKTEVDRGHADEYYNDDQIRIIEPQNETAACYYGQGTRWCTAGKNNNLFDTYAQDGSIYIIIPKQPSYPGEKYQFHFESNQFMDPQDDPVDLSALAKKYPGLKNAFWDQAGRYDIVAFMDDEQIAELGSEGDQYIRSHGKDHGDGIITINLNVEDPYNFQLVPAVANQVGAAVGKDLNPPRDDEETLYNGYAVVDTKNNEVYVAHSYINYDGVVSVDVGNTFTNNVSKNAKNPRTEEIINNLLNDLELFLIAQGDGDEDLEVKFAQLIEKYGRGVE
jgi:hypothetical protein